MHAAGSGEMTARTGTLRALETDPDAGVRQTQPAARWLKRKTGRLSAGVLEGVRPTSRHFVEGVMSPATTATTEGVLEEGGS